MAILSCGKFCTALQTGIVPRFSFCWDLGDSIDLRWSMYLRESNVRFHQLDVTHISVSHSSIESDVISSDAGLRMDGLPALDLWESVDEVLHSSSIQARARGNQSCDKHIENILSKERRNRLTRRKILVGQMLITSHQTKNFLASMLCFFLQDNEAVIKMIIKGRSPTTGDVS